MRVRGRYHCAERYDGQACRAIRQALDAAGFTYTPIMAYSQNLHPDITDRFVMRHIRHQFGDRKTYQMDPANGREACGKWKRILQREQI